MSLESSGVSEPSAPAQPSYDFSDWVVLALVAGGFVASWVWVYLHPTVEAFGMCIGGVGTFGGLFHFLRIADDKRPDHKDG